MTLNKICFDKYPSTYPDSDRGNFRLYYELELVKSAYESNPQQILLERYVLILNTLGERGLYANYYTDLAIDKAAQKADWNKIIQEDNP